MKISFDPAKNAHNVAERGLSFDRAADFDFDTAKLWQDTRRAYPENRFVAIGYLDDRLHVLVFSETEHGIRVISFRKANVTCPPPSVPTKSREVRQIMENDGHEEEQIQ